MLFYSLCPQPHKTAAVVSKYYYFTYTLYFGDFLTRPLIKFQTEILYFYSLYIHYIYLTAWITQLNFWFYIQNIAVNVILCYILSYMVHLWVIWQFEYNISKTILSRIHCIISTCTATLNSTEPRAFRAVRPDFRLVCDPVLAHKMTFYCIFSSHLQRKEKVICLEKYSTLVYTFGNISKCCETIYISIWCPHIQYDIIPSFIDIYIF